ncbi:hypothetical protein Plhal304r1_c047g0128271 [Plasmopara halstedii]
MSFILSARRRAPTLTQGVKLSPNYSSKNIPSMLASCKEINADKHRKNTF